MSRMWLATRESLLLQWLGYGRQCLVPGCCDLLFLTSGTAQGCEPFKVAQLVTWLGVRTSVWRWVSRGRQRRPL